MFAKVHVKIYMVIVQLNLKKATPCNKTVKKNQHVFWSKETEYCKKIPLIVYQNNCIYAFILPFYKVFDLTYRNTLDKIRF